MKKKNIVKSSQSKVYILLAAVLIIGWIVTLALLTDNSDEEEQHRLYEQAKAFEEDEIYIRAANSLNEALNYTTDHNPQIEEKLLEVYKAGGFEEEYADFATKRIESDTASRDEYYDVANYLLSRGDTSGAVLILKKAVKKYPDDEEFAKLYDGNRFVVTEAETEYPDYLAPTSLHSIPVSNGEKWGYATNNGRKLIDCTYSEVLPFFGDYAVVKKSNVYELIDSAENRWALDKNGLDEVVMFVNNIVVGKKDNSYALYSRNFTKLSEEDYEDAVVNENGLICVKKGGKWAILDSDLKKVTDFVFTDMVKNSRGQIFKGRLAMAADDGGYFLIDDTGAARFDARFKGAKGAEGGPIAVKDNSGKWGFINLDGNLLIPCEYADAKSFSCDVAAVYYAGNWSYISTRKETVIPGNFVEAEPFVDGYTVVKNELGICSVLKLTYYEYYK